MPQLCVAAYGCLEGMWLPTSGHCCLNSIAYIGDSHYLDIDSNNAVIINVHLCSHSEHELTRVHYRICGSWGMGQILKNRLRNSQSSSDAILIDKNQSRCLDIK
jgi:hypothetical protein